MMEGAREVAADAEYYQAHKDAEDEWGDRLPTRPSEKRRLAAMVSVRFTPEEQERVRAAAESAGESVSNFVRQLVLRECSPSLQETGNRTGSVMRWSAVMIQLESPVIASDWTDRVLRGESNRTLT